MTGITQPAIGQRCSNISIVTQLLALNMTLVLLLCRHTPLAYPFTPREGAKPPAPMPMPTVAPLKHLTDQLNQLLGLTAPECTPDGRQLKHRVATIAQQLLDQYPPLPGATRVTFTLSADAAKFSHNAKGTSQTSVCLKVKDPGSHTLEHGLPSAAMIAQLEGNDHHKSLATPHMQKYAYS